MHRSLGRSIRLHRRAAVISASVAITALAGLQSLAHAQSARLTVAGFGGNQQKDFHRALWSPAAKKVGASLREESHDGTLAQLRLQVQSGKPGWDLVHLGSDDCAVGAAEGLFEPLDYQVIATDGMTKGLYGEHWVAINTYSVVLAWNTEMYKNNPPKNWVDFWNVVEFPGRRAMQSTPSETTEIALLGDGVTKENLYPMDVPRALASLEKIKPHVTVWYGTGAQSAQLIRDEEVDMIAITGSRIYAVLQDGARVSFTYQDALLSTGCMAILKGSPNVALAQQFLAQVISADIQANIPTVMPYYGPVNEKAYEAKAFAPEVLARSNMAPENRALQVQMDVNWWRDHIQEVAGPFRQTIAQ